MTTTFTSLSVPLADDTMEMSSPANRHLDDDIDIDFEDDPGGVHMTDDERMLEAGDTRPNTATDDMMDDDGVVIGEETEMQEDFPQQEDEELIDYGEDEPQDQPIEDADADFLNDTDELPAIAEAPVVQAYQSSPPELEPEPVLDESAIAAEHVFEEIAPEVEQATELAVVEETEVALVSAEDDVHAQEDDGVEVQQHTHEVEEEYHTAHDEQPHTDPEAVKPHAPPPVDTSTTAAADTPGTPTDTGLHPTNIRYADLHIPLFKSKRQPDGLLNNDNLASLSLAELIQNCRQRLPLKTGEELSEDQELVLGFENLGLSVVEDSRAAFESSLNEVLEVYLQLHRNDGTDEIPPLWLHFTLQLKFSSSFGILKQAAAAGQGMATFGFLHADEAEQYYEGEEYNERPEEAAGEEAVDDQYYDEPAYADNPEAAGHTEEYQGHDGAYGQEDDFYGDQGEFPEEPAEETYTEDYQDHLEGHAEDLHAEQEPANAKSSAQRVPSATAKAKATKDATETVKDTDSASSTTIQGDQSNDKAGEYTPDPDYIDWDDDSDLTTNVYTSDPEVDNEFSTFLTELDSEDAQATKSAHHALNQDALPVTTHEATGATEGEDTHDAYNDDFGDFLNDPDDHEPSFTDNHGDFQPLEGHGYEEVQEHYDQADTFDEQHGYQPGEDEDDDQFHTTHDFLNGDHYEHGPEHDIYDNEDEDGLDDTTNTVLIHPVDEEYAEEEYAEEDLEDEVDFDQDATEQAPDTTHKPVGKRSFDDLGELEDSDDEPEAKKPRAS